jgi:hypothetical protein
VWRGLGAFVVEIGLQRSLVCGKPSERKLRVKAHQDGPTSDRGKLGEDATFRGMGVLARHEVVGKLEFR